MTSPFLTLSPALTLISIIRAVILGAIAATVLDLTVPGQISMSSTDCCSTCTLLFVGTLASWACGLNPGGTLLTNVPCIYSSNRISAKTATAIMTILLNFLCSVCDMRFPLFPVADSFFQGSFSTQGIVMRGDSIGSGFIAGDFRFNITGDRDYFSASFLIDQP